MKTLVFCLTASLLVSLTSHGQEKCVLAIKGESATERVERDLRLLNKFFNGTPANAALAVDRILTNVQLRVAEANPEKTRQGLGGLNSTTIAQEQIDRQQNAMKRLEDALNQKTEGFFKIFRKKSLRSVVQLRMNEVSTGEKGVEQLIDSVRKNIESLREQQMNIEIWEAKINAEIDYLQAFMEHLNEGTFASNASLDFIRNVNEEALPRLLSKANDLMVTDLLMVKTLASGIQMNVRSELGTLENLLTLQNVSRELALRRAQSYLAESAHEAERLEQEQTEAEDSCFRKKFCRGETVFIFGGAPGQYSRADQVLSGSITETGSSKNIVLLNKGGGAKKLHQSILARSQQGLSSNGHFVGGKVVRKSDRDEYWHILGIFQDGNLLLQRITSKNQYYTEESGLTGYNYYVYSRMDPSLVQAAP